ncbi:MAG: SPFH domain-containing protein [Sulfolobales archaeon]|nr:SPFH/Band 7/PHB domain protein [Sulfolobales archaeon]MDW8082172.1 SPFH domain-containing protein [Sulfolobales archaeon]
MDIFTLITVVLALVFVASIVARSIRIVPEYERLIVFRLGRMVGVRGPGLVVLVPLIDSAVKVDLREFVIDIPPQTCITKDNAPVDIDLLVYIKVFDPALAITSVSNYITASTGIAMTTLRAVVGDLLLDDVLAKREYINSTLRAKLDEITDRWGIKVTSVEIKEIKPPRDVQEAMIKQMAAERNRRAMILEADGKKQAAILEAEGYRESQIKKAEGDKQAAVLRAEGISRSLELVNESASRVAANTLFLQYLEAISKIAESPSTKIILPMELVTGLTTLVRTVGLGERRESEKSAE